MPTPLATKRAQIRERQRRFRAKKQAGGMVEFRGLMLSPAQRQKLELAALFMPRQSVPELIAHALEIYVEKVDRDTTPLLRVIHQFWPRIREYRPYFGRLSPTNPTVRIKDRVLTMEEAARLHQIYSDIRRNLSARGVSSPDVVAERIYQTILSQKLFSPSKVTPSPSSS
jgi:hypothetical protein